MAETYDERKKAEKRRGKIPAFVSHHIFRLFYEHDEVLAGSNGQSESVAEKVLKLIRKEVILFCWVDQTWALAKPWL